MTKSSQVKSAKVHKGRGWLANEWFWYAGEVLGCTAPTIVEGADSIIFVADGRFHLEAIMMANPCIPAFR